MHLPNFQRLTFHIFLHISREECITCKKKKHTDIVLWYIVIYLDCQFPAGRHSACPQGGETCLSQRMMFGVNLSYPEQSESC